MFGLTGKRSSDQKMTSHKPTFKPHLEALEMREVLSASSAAMHAVAPPAGHPTQQNVFYIDQTTHLLKDGSIALNGKANTPSGVQALSAGHDPLGFADVFVTAGDGSFWRFNEGNWTKMLGPNQVKSFAAVDGGRVYAIFQDNTLHEFNGSSWLQVPGSGTVKALDAVTDTGNCDTVFVLSMDGSFWDFSQFKPGSTFLTDKLANSSMISRIVNFSAGTDSIGRADVYATFLSPFQAKESLYKIGVGGSVNGWTFVADASNIRQFSATDHGAVWVNTSDGSLYEYDTFGHIQNKLGESVFALSLSAASSTDVYFVDAGHEVNEWVYDPNVTYWELFSDLGASQQ
jgi:hypothetical protein